MDGTEERKDTLPNKGLPSGETKGTSKDKGKLYSDAQIAKIKSDAAAEAGRQRKTAEKERDALKQDLQSTTSRLDALERDINESRLAEARGDPDQLRIYQREQAITKLERQVAELQRDLTRREEQLKADRAEVDKDRGVVSIAYIAAKHGLKTEQLESYGISDPEVLERVAVDLAAAKPKELGEEEGEGGEGEGEEFTPDSGETTGGGAGALTPESVEKMSMPALEKAIEKAEPKS